MKLYQVTVRERSDITKRFAVQAHDEEDAEELSERLLMNNMETIMYMRQIPEKLREGNTLQDIVDMYHDIDYLLCTGGKWPSMVHPTGSVHNL